MDEPKPEILQAITAYVRHGWHVFPCKPGEKQPLTAHGLNDATNDGAAVRGWWRKWPTANVGIRTGAVSGFFVLDVDAGKGGDDSLAAMEAKYGPLPDTPTSMTGGGGRHFLFQHPGRTIRNATKLAGWDGIDIRGDGGYIVAPPSIHPNGRIYAWDAIADPEDTAIALSPAWLLSLMAVAAPKPPAPVARLSGLNDIGRAAEALTRLAASRCENYQEWVEVGMALTPLGDVGLALWDQWSQSCSDKYQPEACPRKWASFRRNGLGVGSLIRWAQNDNPGKVADVQVRGFVRVE